MHPVIAYLLGVATPFVLGGLFMAVAWAFSRSSVLAHESTCRLCASVGIRERLPRGEHRLTIAQAIHDARHRLVARCSRRHRQAWQAHFDAHPGLLGRSRAGAWRRYGTHPVAGVDN